MSDATLILYSTSACHLCEHVSHLITPIVEALDITLETVDISDSDELIERYGIRIPVLADMSGAELDWPFSEQQFTDFLENSG